METHERFKSWLKIMGYQGKMPSSFDPFCNPNTALIWEQLMQQVKPKNEIARIRNNILIKRFSSSELNLQNEFKHPVKEMELWKRKQSLCKNVSNVNEQITKLKSDLDALAKSVRMKYLKIDVLRSQIRQVRNYSHLLNRKCAQLGAEISEVREQLTLACNLTPVETDCENDTVVCDTVRECIARLERIIESESCTERQLGSSSDNDSLGLLTESHFLPVRASSPVIMDGTAYDSSISKDRILQDSIRGLFGYNRREVCEYICRDNESQLHDLSMGVLDAIVPMKKDSSTPITPSLYWTHIDLELKTLQLRSRIARLESTISDIDLGDLTSLSRVKPSESGLTRAIPHLRHLINSFLRRINDVNLAQTEEEVARVDKDIIGTFETVAVKQNMSRQVHGTMEQMRGDCSLLARKLGKFTSDCNWLQLLNNNVCSIEINTFLKYPLEYCRMTKSNHMGYHTFEPYDSNMLQYTLALFPDVWCPPEVMLINVVRQRERLLFLKSSAYTFNARLENGTLDLLDQESYVNYAIDKLRSIIKSKAGTSNINKKMQECLELWIEMPFQSCIPDTRVFEGLPYSHYRDLYENYYKQL
ncbi:uncharacterized protein LOC116161059 isoform X2 [Photinus pyralis]|uniref:uncharacterized protein LOC116161059 isoform X2 n=1 Tax=Photinus pyralis TaxID=7054 RepID=UPI00126751CF|nr:uncharacterized protein LOC116161059 isoform X2 [Photinus pyralis]